MGASRRNPKIYLVAAVFAGCLIPLVIVNLPALWPSAWLAERLQRELKSAPDDQVIALAEQLAALGDQGLPQLVDCLSSSRASERTAAEEVLRAQVESWRRSTPSESAHRMARLMELIAQRIETIDKQSLPVAGKLAMISLDWPTVNTDVSGTRLAFHCEQVLQAARAAGIFEVVEVAEPVKSEEATPTRLTISDDPEPSGDAATGAVEAAITDGQETSADPVDEPDAITAAESPPVSDEPSIFVPPALFPHMIGSGLEADTRAAEILNQPYATPKSAGETMETNSPETMYHLTDLEVISLLPDELHRDEAKAELRSRGFREGDIAVATLFADPDPVIRSKVATGLSEQLGIDGLPWLLLLTKDESPRVRAAAIRRLATSLDPRVHKHLLELEERESDETVLQALRHATARGRR